MIDIVVNQGAVHVNSISIMHESDEHVIYHIDTRDKWPEIEAESTKSIFLIPQSDNPDQYHDITAIVFKVPEGWYKVCQAGKYHVDVAFYKRIKHNEDAVVWWDEMDLL